MPTRAEMNAAREERDAEMVVLIGQGKTARQIAAILGVTASTIRGRAERAGLQCETVQLIGPAQMRAEENARPCTHAPGECKSVHCLGHRFGADLSCSSCGTDWHEHQLNGLRCESPLDRPERVEMEHPPECCNGHDCSTPESLYTYLTGAKAGKKECKECRNEQSRRSYDKMKNGGTEKEPRTHCNRGHELTEENSYLKPGRKSAVCRTCRRIIDARRRERGEVQWQ